jgi:hypothetical protein
MFRKQKTICDSIVIANKRFVPKLKRSDETLVGRIQRRSNPRPVVIASLTCVIAELTRSLSPIGYILVLLSDASLTGCSPVN